MSGLDSASYTTYATLLVNESSFTPSSQSGRCKLFRFKKIEWVMLSVAMNHKVKTSIGMLMLFLCSVSVTLIYQNTVSDSISISFSVMLGIGIFVITFFILLEAIHAVCNP